jgi:hypothetical protein
MSEGFQKCERLFRKFTQLRGLAEDELPQENLWKTSEASEDEPQVESGIGRWTGVSPYTYL